MNVNTNFWLVILLFVIGAVVLMFVGELLKSLLDFLQIRYIRDAYVSFYEHEEYPNCVFLKVNDAYQKDRGFIREETIMRCVVSLRELRRIWLEGHRHNIVEASFLPAWAQKRLNKKLREFCLKNLGWRDDDGDWDLVEDYK